MRRVGAIALVAALLGVPAAHAAAPPFESAVSVIRKPLRERMTGVSWRPGCPVALRDLRLVTVRHFGFDGRVRTGKIIVHEDIAGGIVSVFRTLYDERFPIRRMRLVDAYGGSDFESIEADNTSAFNCRAATGSSSWSQHAYGLAIDVNPIENPYVESGHVYHDASRRYIDRSKRLDGMIHANDLVVRAFARVGWGWGGAWAGNVKDYQHFAAPRG